MSRWVHQDMLVDLETAKLELEMANTNAQHADRAARAFHMQLRSTQQQMAMLKQDLEAANMRYVSVSYHEMFWAAHQDLS